MSLPHRCPMLAAGALLVCCWLLTFSACRRRTDEPQLHLGIIAPAFNHLPLDMALSTGGMKGVALRIWRFNSGWELGEALIAGRLDCAIIPFTYVISARAQGAPVRIVSCLEHEDDGIIARAGIEDLSQLQGKTIGCLKASTIELLLHRALEMHGITARTVYFSSPMEMWAALERCAVDALSYYVPGIIKAHGQLGRIIHWYGQDWPWHPCCDVAIHEARTKSRLTLVKRFLAGLEVGCTAIAADTARACSLAVAVYGLSDSVALESLRHTPFRLSLTPDEQEFELALADRMHRLGYLERQVSADQLYSR